MMNAACSGYAIQSETGSGLRMAKVFGTCSPMTMWSEEKTRKPIRKAMRWMVSSRHAERLEQRRDDGGDRGLADPAEAERGHGDAELAAGEIGFDVFQHDLRERGAEAFVLGQRVDAEGARFHQRELGGDVKGVGREQQERDEQAQKWAGH